MAMKRPCGNPKAVGWGGGVTWSGGSSSEGRWVDLALGLHTLYSVQYPRHRLTLLGSSGPFINHSSDDFNNQHSTPIPLAPGRDYTCNPHEPPSSRLLPHLNLLPPNSLPPCGVLNCPPPGARGRSRRTCSIMRHRYTHLYSLRIILPSISALGHRSELITVPLPL